MQVVPPVPDELDRLDRVLREMGVDPDAEWDFLNDNTDVPGRFQSEMEMLEAARSRATDPLDLQAFEQLKRRWSAPPYSLPAPGQPTFEFRPDRENRR